MLLQRRSAIGARCPKANAEGFRFHHVSTDEVFGSLGATGTSARIALSAEFALFGVEGGRPIIWCAPGITPTACRC